MISAARDVRLHVISAGRGVRALMHVNVPFS